jgi:AcrR family transcriptional regulator
MSAARRKRKCDYHHGDLRNALRDAAWSALESGGVERLSLRELAQTLGVSYAAPSHHFQDKEDLLDELRQMAWTRFADALESALAARAAALASSHAYVRFAPAHPHALQLMFRPSTRGPTAKSWPSRNAPGQSCCRRSRPRSARSAASTSAVSLRSRSPPGLKSTASRCSGPT